MAIAETTAPTPGETGGGVVATTGSFSPPAGSLLVALVAVLSAPYTLTIDMSDSTDGTWTELETKITSGSFTSLTSVWVRYLDTAPGSMTVTSTIPTNQSSTLLDVRVLTGAASDQSTAAVASIDHGTGGAPSVTVPVASDAWVYGATSLVNEPTPTPVSGSELLTGWDDTAHTARFATFRSTTAVSASGVFGFSNSTGGVTAAVGILADSGGGAPVAPTAAFTHSESGLTATFDGSGSTSGVTYSWDFGDSSTASTDESPSHTYAESGTYTVTLTVTDSGGSDTATASLTVTAPSEGGATAPVVVDSAEYSTSSQTSIAFQTPADTQTGDLILLEAYVEPQNEGGANASYPEFTFATPVTLITGFPVDSGVAPADQHRLYVWYAYATADGEADYTMSFASAVYMGGTLTVVRGGPTSGNPLAEPVSTAEYSPGDSNSNGTTPAVSLTLGGDASLVLWAFGDWNGTQPSGTYPDNFTIYAASTNHNGQPFIAQATYPSAGDTGDVVATGVSGIDNGMTAALMSFRAPVSIAPTWDLALTTRKVFDGTNLVDLSTTNKVYALTGTPSDGGGDPPADSLLPSLDRVAWEGTDYWRKFAAAPAAWDDSFFPVMIFYGTPNSNAHALYCKAHGINVFTGGPAPIQQAWMTENDLYWAGAAPTTGWANDDNWAMDWLDDETDGQYSAAAGLAHLQAIEDSLGDDGRPRYVNYTKMVVQTNSSVLDQADEEAYVNEFGDLVSLDQYWYTVPSSVFAGIGYNVTVNSAQVRTASSYGQMVRGLRIRDASDGVLKRLTAFVEDLNGGPSSGQGDGTYITAGQLMGAVMSVIIAEARAIVYFNSSMNGSYVVGDVLGAAYGGDDTYIDQMNAMKTVNLQVQALASVLNTQSYVWDTGNDGLDTMLKAADGYAYLFAQPGWQAEATSVPGVAQTINLPSDISGTSIEVVNEDRTLTAVDGSFTDTFDYEYSYHIYKVAIDAAQSGYGPAKYGSGPYGR